MYNSLCQGEKEWGTILGDSRKTNKGGTPMLPAVIASIEQAFREIKTYSIESWEGEYRSAARMALKEILQTRMSHWVDRGLQELASRGMADRRNGYFSRHLLTELGDLELAIPRSRTFSAISLLRQMAGGLGRRAGHVERLVLLAFSLGLSTRKVGQVLLPILGERISASTVSALAKQLDTAVRAYQRRALYDRYSVLVLDGVVLKHRTGVGALRRPVLVALGITADGKRELIDFRQAFSESQAEWEGFLNDLYQRGLQGEHLKLIVTDGGKGLKAALPLVFGQIPVQLCWAHKTRNVLDKVRRLDQAAVKKDLHRISHAHSIGVAHGAAQQFIARWQKPYPKAASCLTRDLSQLLTFLRVRVRLPAVALRTTNAIERRFREVKRRTRPMGTFSDHTSIDRILFAVFSYENYKEGSATPFLLTQNT
jgi:putative transposase